MRSYVLLARLIALHVSLATICYSHAEDPDLNIPAEVGVGATTFLRQALGRADLAIAAGKVDTRHLKGAFGEHMTAKYLERGAEWALIQQKVRPQGIDLLHVKVAANGDIKHMMVSEVKTGNSRLLVTKVGKQMSPPWTSRHLKDLSQRYKTAAETTAIAKPAPGSAKHVLEVPFGNGRRAYYWRETPQHPWKLDATEAQVAAVEKQVGKMTQWLDAAGDGKAGYRKRVFEVKIEKSNVVMTVKDASGIGRGLSQSKLPVIDKVVVPAKDSRSVHDSLAKAWENEIRRTQPNLTNSEVRDQARDLAKRTVNDNLSLKRSSLSSQLGGTFAMAGFVVGGFDLLQQFMTTGEVDLQRTGTLVFAGGASGVLGSGAGYGTTNLLTNTTQGLEVSRRVASSLGLGTARYSANLLGGVVGGTAAGVAFSYLLYFAGYADIEAANRMAVAGVAGTLAGAGVAAATTSLVAAFGTAGTGTAISTLSGAAATNATMAAIGGGSMATGSVLMTTGVGAVVVVVGAAVMWGFQMHDEAQENERLELTYEYLNEYYAGRLR